MSWEALLLRIAAEVEPLPSGFRVAGASWPAGPQERPYLLARLVYRRYYQLHDHASAPRRQADLDTDGRHVPATEDAEWVSRLRSAIGGRHSWEPGWAVVRRQDEAVVVRRGADVVVASGDEIRVDGDLATVRFPALRPNASAGFLLTVGPTGAAPRGEGLVRTYLNLRAEHALPAFQHLVRELDAGGIRYAAKILDHADRFGRPDSAVVYASRDDLPSVVAAASALRGRCPDALAGSVPAFTRRLLPGIAVAEEPAGGAVGQSFGRHRSRLVAAGLLATGSDRALDRHASVLEAFRAAGLDPARLHLNPGSSELDVGMALGGAA